MGSLLSRIQASNEVWCRKVPPKNTRFRGVMHPVSPTALPTSVFVLPRISLRCRMGEPIVPGEVFYDPAGRPMMTAEHDTALQNNDTLSRLFSLIQMTGRYTLRRTAQTTKNPVTGLDEMLSVPLAGPEPIWAAIESFTRGDEDAGLRFTVDRLRIITGTPIAEGDMVDGKSVKRVLFTLGVYVGEIQ